MKRNIIIAAIASVVVIGTGTVVGINAHHNAGDKEKVVISEAMTSDVEENEIVSANDINEGAREETCKETDEGAREESKEAVIADMKSAPDKRDFNEKGTARKDNSVEEKKADKEEKPVHTHNYKKTVTAPATCITNGVVTYICECGSAYEESALALGHNFADGPSCLVCGTANPDYVAPHIHTWTVEEHFTLNHTNEGHYAPYICECRLDFQNYEDLEAHQEETAIKSREAYRDENGVWHGDIAHGGWCNGWVVEREWDIYTVTHKEICECGAVGNEWVTSEEVTCTCIHYGPDMHFHFADRDCCHG